MFGKIIEKNVNTFLKQPNELVNSILLYGSDENVIFHRSNIIKKTYEKLGYQTTQLSCDLDQNAISIAKNEISSRDFFTSKKLILIDQIKDKQFLEIKDLIDEIQDCKLVLIGTGITKTSKIRIFHEETSKKTASIACYPLEKSDCKFCILDFLKKNEINLEENLSIDTLVEKIGQNPIEIDNELAKISILCEKTKILTEKNIESLSSSSEDCSFNLIDSFFLKKIQEIAKYSEQCENGEVSPVLIARGLYKYACKLINSQINIKNGSNQSNEAKINGIFFKKYNIFYNHLTIWTKNDLEKLTLKLLSFDKNTRTGAKLLPEILNLLR